MKKGLKIFALGVAALGIGCVALTGCGTTDEFANADEISVSDFNTYQSTTTDISNDLDNFTITFTASGLTLDGHCIISTDSVQFLCTVTGDGVSMQYYLEGENIYVYDGTSKVYYEYSTFSDDYFSNGTLESFSSIDSLLSQCLENSEDELTIKKLTTDAGETKFQISIDNDTQYYTSYKETYVITYDSTNQMTKTTGKTTAVSETSSYTSSFVIAKSDSQITRPSDIDSYTDLTV